MIVVEVKLYSAITHKETMLNTVVIDNIEVLDDKGLRCTYRCRVMKRGQEVLDLAYGKKPIRTAVVENHPRHSKPVLNLVFKALQQLGYGK